MNKTPKIVLIGFLLATAAGFIPLTAQSSDWRPKFRIEFGAGWLSTSFGDVGLIGDAADAAQKFLYDDRFTAMYTNTEILYWSFTGLTDGFPQFKNAIPLDVRLRFQSPWDLVTFSLGFRSISQIKDQTFSNVYERTVSETESHTELMAFNPYRMSINAYAIPLTFFYNMTDGEAVDASLFVSVGPSWGSALLEKSWTEAFEQLVDGERSVEAPPVNHSLRMEGKGVGVLVEGGTRLDFNMGSLLSVFIEAGFTYQSVFSFKGKGREVNGSVEENWEGQWMIRATNLDASWGTTSIDFIDSRPTKGSAVWAEKAFTFSSSGGTVRGGISIRF
jgi:hypothetical protein